MIFTVTSASRDRTTDKKYFERQFSYLTKNENAVKVNI